MEISTPSNANDGGKPMCTKFDTWHDLDSRLFDVTVDYYMTIFIIIIIITIIPAQSTPTLTYVKPF